MAASRLDELFCRLAGRLKSYCIFVDANVRFLSAGYLFTPPAFSQRRVGRVTVG